jgi:hypothetical protein
VRIGPANLWTNREAGHHESARALIQNSSFDRVLTWETEELTGQPRRRFPRLLFLAALCISIRYGEDGHQW